MQKGIVVALLCSALGHGTGSCREEACVVPPAKLRHTLQVSLR